MIDPELLIQRIDALAEDLFWMNPDRRDQYRHVLRGQLVAMISADPDKMGTIAAATDDQIRRMLELNIAKMGPDDQTLASAPPPFDPRLPPAQINPYCEEPSKPKPAESSGFAKPAIGSAQPPAKIVYCCQCGEVNPFNSATCLKCGTPLHEPVKITNPFPRPEAQIKDAGGGSGSIFIPKNTNALIGYYLGVFCILQFFCIGIPILSIPAVIFGVLGLMHENKHPEAKGGIHSWVGIIVGVIMTLISTIFFIGFMI